MTKNQIDYWRNQEQHRANVANEKLSNRQQRWKEFVDFHNLREQRRTNVANEGIKERSQVATAQHYQRMDAETNRANLAREALTSASNELAKQQLILGYHQADVSRANAQTSAAVGYANVAEQSRSNKAREQETNRANLQQEYLTSLQRGAQARDVLTREAQLDFERSKWNDSVVTAQRKADLNNTIVKTKDVAENIVDRRVRTITGSVSDLASSLGNIIRGGRSYINLN